VILNGTLSRWHARMIRWTSAESVHDRDRIIVRLPDGLREKIAARAADNGRSMTSEVVAALEKYLESADRVTELSDFVERHRANIEAIDHLWSAIEDIERYLHRTSGGDSPQTLSTWSQRNLMRIHEEARAAAVEQAGLGKKQPAKEDPPA
jgi:plasmid stability protein